MLDIDPFAPTAVKGRRPGAPSADFVRSLTAEDISALDAPRASAAPPLSRLRDRHHAVARLLAEGRRPAEVSAITGYSASRISVLQADPAFAELLAFYRENAQAAFADLHERLASVAGTATDILLDRMEENPDAIGEATLVEIAKFGADRTGHGPASKNTNVNINVNMADRLARARERLEAHRSGPGRVIEGEAQDVTPLLAPTDQKHSARDPSTSEDNHG